MSAGGPGRREVAHRLFAAEYDDASLEYAESDEERAPNYVVTPGGARVNRLFVVGVLTAVEQVNEDTVRARIADPTGVFVVYAGQYQPDELAALQSLESPAFVAVTGKANTFSPEGSDRVLTSVRPERVTEVDAETRDRWVVATAEHTLARIQTIASALQREERGEELRAALLRDGVEPGFAEGVSKALDHYDTTADYLGALRDLANQALEVVAGDRSEVAALDLAPDDGDGTVSAGDLTDHLPEERQSATEAAEDVDPEVLLDSDASDAGEPAVEVQGDAGQGDDGPADEETGTGADGEADTGADEEAEAETGKSSAEEPVTDERAVEATADDAEEAADADPERSEEAEPETSESAVEETAGDAEAAAETQEGDGSPEADDADELYEVDEEEREEIEEEYGVEFQSGTEVDPAGEAGIETEDEPPAEDEPTAEAESVEEDGSLDEDEAAAEDVDDEAPDEEDAEETDASNDGGEDESDSGEEADSDEADGSAEDVDLEGAVLSEMETLDEGDGADRETLVEAVAGETGADADAIDDAIDDLLMSGQCYEPSEGRLKPI